MNKNWFKPLIFVIPFSFIMGLAWGLKLIEKDASQPITSSDNRLSILIQSDFIPNYMINEFSKKHNLQISVKRVNNTYELIREILNAKNQYDLVQVISYDLNFYDKTPYKKSIDLQSLDLENKISADFTRIIPERANRYLPLQWDIDSFVTNKNLKSSSLVEILKSKNKHKVLLTSSPTDLYLLAKRLRLVIDEWVFTNQTDKMSVSLGTLFNKAQALPRSKRDDLKGFDIIQVNLAERDKLISGDKNMHDYFMDEKIALKVYGLAVNENITTSKADDANLLLKFLSGKKQAYIWSKTSRRATTLTSLNNSELPAWLKADYIRTLPLKKINIPNNHFGYESTWIEVLKGVSDLKNYPTWSNVNAVGMVKSKKN